MAVIRYFITHMAMIIFLVHVNNSNDGMIFRKKGKERYSGERFVDTPFNYNDGLPLKKRDILGDKGGGSFFHHVNRNEIDAASIVNIPKVKLDYEVIMSKRSNVPDNDRAKGLDKRNLPFYKELIFKQRNFPNIPGMISMERNFSDDRGILFKKRIVPDDVGVFFKKRNVPDDERTFFKKTNKFTPKHGFYWDQCNPKDEECLKKRNVPDNTRFGIWYKKSTLIDTPTDFIENRINVENFHRGRRIGKYSGK